MHSLKLSQNNLKCMVLLAELSGRFPMPSDYNPVQPCIEPLTITLNLINQCALP